MNEMKKILDEYKLSAKDILKKLAIASGYDDISIYDSAILDEKVLRFTINSTDTSIVNSTFIWTRCKDNALSNCISAKNNTIKRKTDDAIYTFFLKKILLASSNGETIYALTQKDVKDRDDMYVIVIDPFETLESILIRLDLEDIQR